MGLPDLDSSVGHSFGLEVDGITIKHISEVKGLTFEQDVIELKQNTSDGKYMIKKLPGRRTAKGNVTLVRGLDADTSFEQWIKNSRFGKMSDVRKMASISVYDFEGAPIKRYKLTNAWPTKLEIGSLKAGDTSVLTETLTLTYEDLEVE